MCSAPEHFQRVMSRILNGLEGVVCLIDDTLVFGHTKEEHDRRLTAVLTSLETAGVMLNKDKCSFGQESLKFLGHVIDKEGIRPDPDKTAAIWDMPAPQNISDLRRFMGMVTQLGKFTHMIKQCHMCAKEAVAHKEPIIAAQLPTYPWQKIGSDLFELNGATYMLVVDYFYRYIEIVQVTVTSSMGIIEKLKPMFSRQGIPEFIVSDNGPQYSSHKMKEFAQLYGFTHITSSPRYPQSNGQAERAVQTVKKLLRTSGDLYLSVLNCNATPMPWCGFSPSELLMGRKVRTTVPQVAEHFCPKWPFLDQFYRKNQEFKRQQEKQYNRRLQTRPQLKLEEGEEVWINTDGKNTRGYVTSSLGLTW